MKKRMSMLLALAMCLSFPASYSAEATTEAPAEEAAAGSVTVTDDSGQELTIDLPVESVVPTDSGPFTVLAAFDKLGIVTGTHQSVVDDPLFAQLQDKPVIASWSEINYEMLAELAPQVVISSMESHGYISENENLKSFDIKDVKVDLRNPDKMRNDITLLGQIFQSEEKAEEINAFYDKWQNFVDEREADLKDEDRVRVFLEYHGGPFNTGTVGSAWYSQIACAGGINIVDEDMGTKETTIEVSPEFVAEANPDVIIKEDSNLKYTLDDTAQAAADYEELLSRDGYSSTDAVKNGRVYMVGNDIFSRPGYIVGVCYLAKWFYPDLFEDFDPAEVYEEYMNIFFPGAEVKGIMTYAGE